MKKIAKLFDVDKALMIAASLALVAVAYQAQSFFVIEQQVEPGLIYASGGTATFR